jgi:hypothetical protein
MTKQLLSENGGLLRNARAVVLSGADLCYNAFMEPFYSDHSRLDERSLALHQLVAERVRAAPALLDTARENLRRWQEANGSASSPGLAEWAQILASPASYVVALLAEHSERATRLRQSSPFAGILSEEERRAVYESYSARTYHPRREPNFE